MFEQTLSDLVRGIRLAASTSSISAFISSTHPEILQDLLHPSASLSLSPSDIRSQALLKLVYLSMMFPAQSPDLAPAAFAITEGIGSATRSDQLVAYMAASLSFSSETDVLILLHNTLLAHLTKGDHALAALALALTACVRDPAMTKSLEGKMLALVNSTSVAVRKRALSAFATIADPAVVPALRNLFSTERDSSVILAAVNAIAHLSVSPENVPWLVSLSPALFDLLSADDTPNWTLIKICTIFGKFTPHEPRLRKKLTPVLLGLLKSKSQAISVLVQVIQTLTEVAQPRHPALDQCAETLIGFLKQDGKADPNLIYVALKSLQQVSEHISLTVHVQKISQLISHSDSEISRLSAALLVGIVDGENTGQVVGLFLNIMRGLEITGSSVSAAESLRAVASGSTSHSLHSQPKRVTDSEKTTLANHIISIAMRTNFTIPPNAQALFSMLLQLATLEQTPQDRVRDALIDLVMMGRVDTEYAVNLCNSIIAHTHLEPASHFDSGLLSAAAFIVGEYGLNLEHETSTMSYLLQPNVTDLPEQCGQFYLRAGAKVFSRILSNSCSTQSIDELKETCRMVLETLELIEKAQKNKPNISSVAGELHRLISLKLENLTSVIDVTSLMSRGKELVQILCPQDAQFHWRLPQIEIKAPEILLSKTVEDLLRDLLENESHESVSDDQIDSDDSFDQAIKTKALVQKNEPNIGEKMRAAARKRALALERANDPYYLQPFAQETNSPTPLLDIGDVDSIPIIKLDDNSEQESQPQPQPSDNVPDETPLIIPVKRLPKNGRKR